MNLVSNSGLVGAAGGSGSGGGGGSNDTQTVTVGELIQNNSGGSGAPSSVTTYRGLNFGFGSVSDGTSNIYSGADVERIMYMWDTVYPVAGVYMIIDGTQTNSGWTTLTIGTTAYARTNASFSTTVNAGKTSWTWISGTDATGANNPFSAVGTTTTCVFT
jgi:hypothetical protein|tara:strand:- start:225 stop:704 length:480 start_codon:yes stop_codon:yes gene_type:complete